MPRKDIRALSFQRAIERITPYLEDTENTTYKDIYFDGWQGLAASPVLRAIAEHPPQSLMKRFNKIIHIDCSRWKSRRALQRAIADELKLPQEIMDAFDRQDEEDDFNGVDQGSRAEIGDVARQIYKAFYDFESCLLVFHNGSDKTVNMADFGLPLINWSLSCLHWSDFLHEEATEIALYTENLGHGIAAGVVAQCCLYLLSLNYEGGNIMDYNWATHASNYWVCDGIVEGGQENQAWEAARGLHQELRLEDYSSNTLPRFATELDTPYKRWMFVTNSNMEDMVHPKTTSLFLACRSKPDQPLTSLPSDMFHVADQLHVLKLWSCSFSFSSPPFHCCHNLRFLGLDSCMDQEQGAVVEKKDGSAMEIFQRLWVLEVCYTDWELAFPLEGNEQMFTNIREIHIKEGKIWHNNLAWREMLNLHKLHVTEPSCSWETSQKDEFTGLLGLSGINSKVQVLPCLSKTPCLKTLILDGCVGLDHVGLEGLPPLLESFSFDVGSGGDQNQKAKISHISLASCARLVDFRLQGSLPNLEELDLSCTAIRMLDLKEKVSVQKLQRIFLLGCKKLCSITWQAEGMPQLRLLCIDTRGREAISKTSHDYLVPPEEKYCHAFVAVEDMRFLQSLVLTSDVEKFCWFPSPFKLNICLSCTSKNDRENYDKEKVGPYSTGSLIWSPVHKPLISKTSCIYNDVNVEQITTNIDGRSKLQLQPLDCHVEIGEGMMSGTNMQSVQGIKATIFVMNKIKSLHVHDNSSISAINILEHNKSRGMVRRRWEVLKWLCIERCPKLNTVFTIDHNGMYFFCELETVWVADLLMARSIWSIQGVEKNFIGDVCFAKLRAIYLHSCPMLKFVLPLSWFCSLSSLETLHIVLCGDLKQVFPVHATFLNELATKHQNSMLKFPKLKDMYLHHLSSLEQICEAKIFAPKLKTINIKSCWGLRRLPATDKCRREHGDLVVVDCEKDWWDKLQWDGLNIGHHPSLFVSRHSAYYKKRLLKGMVLR